MRIKSSFHDYYDGIQAEGQDASLIFVRETQRFASDYPREKLSRALKRIDQYCQKLPSISLSLSAKREVPVRLTTGIVVFAGKVYPYLVAHPDMVLASSATKGPTYFYSLEALLTAYPNIVRSKRMEAFFKNRGSNVLLDAAVEGHLPIVTWQAQNLSVNAALTPLQFYKQMAPAQAFQELAMFLGGLAAPEPTIEAISDKYRIQQHGFDKWSFRKQSERSSK